MRTNKGSGFFRDCWRRCFSRGRREAGAADRGDAAGSVALPGPFLRFIGVCEVTGAVGLVLPWLLRIRPGLTPLAAAGLIVIMTGATVMTAVSGPVAPALFPLAVGVLLTVIAWQRTRCTV